LINWQGFCILENNYENLGIMKKLISIAVGCLSLVLATPALTQAQHRGHGDHGWHGNKDREKYIRKREKEYDKYVRERDKQDRKYWKHAYEHDHGRPRWASAHHYDMRHHVYFSDYKTFYDPYRGGYVYMTNGRWNFSVNVPSFLVNVNLGNAAIRVVKDVPLDRRPEEYYDDNEDWDD